MQNRSKVSEASRTAGTSSARSVYSYAQAPWAGSVQQRSYGGGSERRV